MKKIEDQSNIQIEDIKAPVPSPLVGKEADDFSVDIAISARNSKYGKDMREFIAQGFENMGVLSLAAKQNADFIEKNKEDILTAIDWFKKFTDSPINKLDKDIEKVKESIKIIENKLVTVTSKAIVEEPDFRIQLNNLRKDGNTVTMYLVLVNSGEIPIWENRSVAQLPKEFIPSQPIDFIFTFGSMGMGQSYINQEGLVGFQSKQWGERETPISQGNYIRFTTTYVI